MDREPTPEVIEHEMEGTRQSLTDKVAALEQQVVGTLNDATATVKDTVDTVKETVQSVRSAVEETMSSVKEGVSESVTTVQEGFLETFNVPKHVRNQPWMWVSGAAVAGFATGLIAFRKSSRRSRRSSQVSAPLTQAATGPMSQYSPPPLPNEYAPPPPQAKAPETPRQPGWFDSLLKMAGDEVQKVGELAITTLVDSVKENLRDGIPKLVETVPTLVQERLEGHIAHPGPNVPPPPSTAPAGGPTGSTTAPAGAGRTGTRGRFA